MRWFVASMVALLLAWGIYLASPYWALYGLAAAVQSGNPDELSSRVNFRALRLSVVRQILTDLDAVPAEAQSTAKIVAAAADPLIAAVLDPRLLTGLLKGDPGGPPETLEGPLASARHLSWGSLADILAASRWRGFRNVFFALPPRLRPGSRYRLQLRLVHLRWIAVSLELPTGLRARLVNEIRKRRLQPG